MARRNALATWCALAVLTLAGGADAKRIATISVPELKPGMKGHAVTVFQGAQSDRFDIEIMDTIPNYLPKQDAVLFRSTDPRLVHSGIVGGMSGSPIFVGGKMVGALSYGWSFNKDAMGALTPIENMLAVGRLPYRPDVLPHPKTGGRKRRGTAGWADVMLGIQSSPLPARRRSHDLDPTSGLIPLKVPLSVAGMGPGPARMLFETFGLAPVRGGSSGKAKTKAPPWKWSPGDAVSVVLIDGDSSVAGNGTVTWVGPKGKRLLAFGHSMFEDGPANLPMANSRVHTIINSVQRSVKISSPRDIQGVMYQDRQAAIALRTDLRAPMIPVTTTMRGPDPDMPARRYDNRIAMGVDVTANLVAVILAEAVDEAGHDATEVVIKVRHEIGVTTSSGPRDIEIEEEVFFAGGLVGRVMGRSRGVATLSAVLDNDFEVGKIREIKHTLSMEYGAPLEQIRSLRLRESQVRAGDLVRLEMILRDYKDVERKQVLPLRIPDNAAGEEVVIQVAGGDVVRPYRPIPGNLDDLITTLQAAYPSRSIVATVFREGEGLSTRNGLMHQLPDSVLETLVDRGTTRRSVKLKQMSRRVIPTKRIIEGVHAIRVDVLPRKSFGK